MVNVQMLRMGGQLRSLESGSPEPGSTEIGSTEPAAMDGQVKKAAWNLNGRKAAQRAKDADPSEGTRMSAKELERYIRELQKLSDSLDRKVQFSVNKELDRVIVKVVDPSTDTIIREIPSQDIQKLQLRMKETLGLLVDKES